MRERDIANIETVFRIMGKIAGDARSHLEQESGKRVISKENYLESLVHSSIENHALEFKNEGE